MTGTEQAFDSYSGNYDAHFTGSRTGWLQRKRVWKFLRRFSPNDFPRILELNCGTGEDAVWLSKAGFQVTATDLSEGMISVTKEKAAAAKSGLRALRADVRAVAEQLKGEKFNMVFSDFGGLNCLSPDELKMFSQKLPGLLQPGAKLVFVVMGTNCRWEKFYYRRKSQPFSPNRRSAGKPVLASIEGHEFPVWYYSPEEFSSFFQHEFQFVRKKPVGLFLPPSYLDPWFANKSFLLRLLAIAEMLFAFPALSNQADHYIVELKLKS